MEFTMIRCSLEKVGYVKGTFAKPKSASLTDPVASTSILAHFMSLQILDQIKIGM